jgi:ribosomal protein L7/L12
MESKATTVKILYPSFDGSTKYAVTISRKAYNEVSKFLRGYDGHGNLGINSQKINAIKALRTETGLGLKEMNEATEIWDFTL